MGRLSNSKVQNINKTLIKLNVLETPRNIQIQLITTTNNLNSNEIVRSTELEL